MGGNNYICFLIYEMRWLSEGRHSILPAKLSLPQVRQDLPWALLGHRVCPTSPQMSSSRLLQIRANPAGNRAPQCVPASCHIPINGAQERRYAGLGYEEPHGKQRCSTTSLRAGDAAVSIWTFWWMNCSCLWIYRFTVQCKKRLWHYQTQNSGYTSKRQRNC